jgi:hypothetical protein
MIKLTNRYRFSPTRLTSNAVDSIVDKSPVTYSDYGRKNEHSRLVLFEQVYNKQQIYAAENAVKNEFNEVQFSNGNDRNFGSEEIRKCWMWVHNSITEDVIDRKIAKKNILRIMSRYPIFTKSAYQKKFIAGENIEKWIDDLAAFQLCKNAEGTPIRTKTDYMFFMHSVLIDGEVTPDKAIDYIGKLYNVSLLPDNYTVEGTLIEGNAQLCSVEKPACTIDIRKITKYYDKSSTHELAEAEFDLEGCVNEHINTF